MMKRMYPVFVFFALAAMVVGCASSARSGSGGTDSSDLPDFVVNPLVQEEVIFGIGGAQKQSSENMAITMAESRARQSLAFQINANVQAMITDYAREAGTQNNTASLEFAESVGRQVTGVNLAGAIPVKRVKTKDGTWWVLVFYSKVEAARTAADII
jgi:hypothetical protein